MERHTVTVEQMSDAIRRYEITWGKLAAGPGDSGHKFLEANATTYRVVNGNDTVVYLGPDLSLAVWAYNNE